MLAGGEGSGGRIVREFGMDRYALLYLKWITNKDQVYVTGNYAQCCVAAWGTGVWGRMDTWICTAEPLLCSPETITTLIIG